VVVVVPDRRFLAIEGAGPRTAADFRLATSILRTVGETVRTAPAEQRQTSHRPVHEICWPVERAATLAEVDATIAQPVRAWRQMIEVPSVATDGQALAAIDMARRLGGRDVPLVRLLHLVEGPAVQILHLWTEGEWATVRRLYEIVFEAGLQPVGDLHELVVVPPAVVGNRRGRSIFRLPVRRA
jgi:hypothetical protein